MFNCFNAKLSMPFKSWFKRSSNKNTTEEDKDAQLQLSLKFMQSQQSDEPVFDISGCNAHFVPDRTFIYCKLLHKTKLLMHDNVFTSLEGGGDIQDLISIQLLDLHSNKFSSLPDDIGYLKNLTCIDVSKNSLKHLPNSFSNLKKLEDINLDKNEFSKVPSCLCALPKLRKISLLDNEIKDFPKNMHNLQLSLQVLNLNVQKLKDPYKDAYSENGFVGLMKVLCKEANVDYTGPSDDLDTTDEPDLSRSKSPVMSQDDVALTSTMENYMRKKREIREKQLALEKEREERDASELDRALQKSTQEKKQMFSEITESATDCAELELKRQEQQVLLQKQIEEQMRELQEVELEAYLANSSGKEKLLENMANLQSQLDKEIITVMDAKDSERNNLLIDLHEGERHTLAVMQEVISAAAQKNTAFVALMEEQDSQLQNLVSTAAGSAADLRQTEVLSAMQKMLAEAVLLEEQSSRHALSNKQGWISGLIEQSEHSDMHIKDALSSRQQSQAEWTNMLLHDQECQAAAFKLLLLNNDLKRSNIMRQINQVEQELVRLSSLELRKKLLSVQFGSTTMLDQRKTLVGLLKSLLSQKTEREQQLEGWLDKMENIHEGGKEAADYWLVQYQRLMDVKPMGLVEAEEQLEPKVVAVLEAARAMDVMPIFARYEITFSKLLNMTVDNAAEIGIGLATFNTIQRALQHYLASVKLGEPPSDDRSPSAPPPPEDDELEECQAAQKEKEDNDRAPSAPCLDESEERAPSAPRITEALFLEAECVVCLEEPSAMVLLPCGHVCVCNGCSGSISQCPMCRSDILARLVLGSGYTNVLESPAE